MVPEIHFLIHSTLTPYSITSQTSSPRTLNLTQVRHKSDSQTSFLVVTCKVKQAMYFQNTVVRLAFSRHHFSRKHKKEGVGESQENTKMRKTSSVRSSRSKSSPYCPYSNRAHPDRSLFSSTTGITTLLATVPTILWFSAAAPCSLLFSAGLEFKLPECYGAALSYSLSSPMCWAHFEIEAPPCLLPHILSRLEKGVNDRLDDL